MLAILNEYFTNIKQAVILATYWNNMLRMSAHCYEHRFEYCTNAKTCFNVHIGAILVERRVLLGRCFNLIARELAHLLIKLSEKL